MEQSLATRSPQPYMDALAGVWGDVEPVLRHLDELAAAPARLAEEDAVAALSALQYRLHAAGEAVLALEPPTLAEEAHADLGAALMVARDATALVGALAGGGVVEPLVYEWRGALFGVRLARLELRQQQAAPAPVPRLAWMSGRQIAATLLTGVAMILAGLVALSA